MAGGVFVDHSSGRALRKKNSQQAVCLRCSKRQYVSRLVWGRRTRQLCKWCGGELVPSVSAENRGVAPITSTATGVPAVTRRCARCGCKLRSTTPDNVRFCSPCQIEVKPKRIEDEPPVKRRYCERCHVQLNPSNATNLCRSCTELRKRLKRELPSVSKAPTERKCEVIGMSFKRNDGESLSRFYGRVINALRESPSLTMRDVYQAAGSAGSRGNVVCTKEWKAYIRERDEKISKWVTDNPGNSDPSACAAALGLKNKQQVIASSSWVYTTESKKKAKKKKSKRAQTTKETSPRRLQKSYVTVPSVSKRPRLRITLEAGTQKIDWLSSLRMPHVSGNLSVEGVEDILDSYLNDKITDDIHNEMTIFLQQFVIQYVESKANVRG